VKKTLFFLIAFYSILIVSQAQAPFEQKNPEGGKGKISGTVVDSASAEPVEFATVALTNTATGKIVDGGVCDEKGSFKLAKIPAGSYSVTISFMGYTNKVFKELSITEGSESIELGKIKLNAVGQVMQEVTVEGAKAVFEEKVDRIVYNAENDETNKGGDATDVLRKAPLLSVDMDGNVSLRGNQNVKVLVNNKPSAIMATNLADALRQIPADQIKSVEVITSPSAKYDAEGSAGIINIVLKKNNLEGFSLGVDGSAGFRGSSLGLNGSYKKGKMGFSLGGHGRSSYNVPGKFENTQLTTSETGVINKNIQQADTRNGMLHGSYSLGWDYDINKNNSISSSVKYGLRNRSSYQDNLSTNSFRNDTLTGISTRNVQTADLSNSLDASLNFTHLFAKPQRELSLLALYSRNNRANDFTNSTMDSQYNWVTYSRVRNENKSYNQEVTAQVDFQNPIGKSQLTEVGVKNISRLVSSEYQYFAAKGADGQYVPTNNSSQNNVFSYNQNVSAAYLSHTLSFLESYSVKVGLRYEYTTIDADFRSQTSKVYIPPYHILVPSINFSKKLSKATTLKASFTRRVQRPSIQLLNPNIQASNPLNISIGNPSLAPEYTNNYELSLNQFTPIGSFTLAAFMRNTTDAIQSVRDVSGDTVRTTNQNIGNEDVYGFNLFTNMRISNKFTLNGGVDLSYSILRNNVPNPLYNAHNEGWSAGYRLSGSYELGRDWGLQLFGFYKSRSVQLQGFQGGFGIYSLSLKKEFLQKKASLGFGFENLFTPAFYIRNSIESPVINQSNVTTLYNFNAKVNFSYRFGKIGVKEEKRKKRKSVNNDDLKDDNDNGNQ
jgi:outer membrane receptor protein involved in Fe transport